MLKVVSRDGTTIAFQRAGDGPPIVLLNGAFRDHTIFDALVPELAPHCTTYVYDRRGRGESGDSPGYAVEREIEDLEAVIEEAGGQAVVFAGSCGANLALEAALAGAPITKLALHEPFYRIEGYPQPPDDFAGNLRALLADDRRGEATEYFLAELLGLTPEVIADWRAGPLWATNEANAHTLVYDTADLRRLQRPGRTAGHAADADDGGEQRRHQRLAARGGPGDGGRAAQRLGGGAARFVAPDKHGRSRPGPGRVRDVLRRRGYLGGKARRCSSLRDAPWPAPSASSSARTSYETNGTNG